MEVVQKFKGKTTVRALLSWSKLSHSSYYYKGRSGKRGRKASRVTLTSSGMFVDNAVVINEIKSVLSIEFICYGYIPMTAELQARGYIINHKKVYRLMNENKLLCGKIIRVKTGQRQFVKYRKIEAEKPLQYLCMDIKYVYIHAEKRNAYLLTLLDVFSRKALGHLFKTSIKQHDVKFLLMQVLGGYTTDGIIIRNDNGSQFIANSVRQYIHNENMTQEFTHIATPEENDYIEAFHSILQSTVIDRYEFDSFYHAQLKLNQFMITYNSIRRHGSLNFKTPDEVWNEHIKSLPSDRQPSAKGTELLSRSADTLLNNQSHQPLRNNLDNSGVPAIFDYQLANDFENLNNLTNFTNNYSQTGLKILS